MKPTYDSNPKKQSSTKPPPGTLLPKVSIRELLVDSFRVLIDEQPDGFYITESEDEQEARMRYAEGFGLPLDSDWDVIDCALRLHYAECARRSKTNSHMKPWPADVRRFGGDPKRSGRTRRRRHRRGA